MHLASFTRSQNKTSARRVTLVTLRFYDLHFFIYFVCCKCVNKQKYGSHKSSPDPYLIIQMKPAPLFLSCFYFAFDSQSQILFCLLISFSFERQN